MGLRTFYYRYHSTSLCFVCSHFAAGQSNITDRNNDYAEAVKRVMFPKVWNNNFSVVQVR